MTEAERARRRKRPAARRSSRGGAAAEPAAAPSGNSAAASPSGASARGPVPSPRTQDGATAAAGSRPNKAGTRAKSKAAARPRKRAAARPAAGEGDRGPKQESRSGEGAPRRRRPRAASGLPSTTAKRSTTGKEGTTKGPSARAVDSPGGAPGTEKGGATGQLPAMDPSPSRSAQPPPAPEDLVPRSDVQAHLFEIQRNLDALLRDVDQASSDADVRQRAAEAIGHIASQLDGAGDLGARDSSAGFVVDQARRLASPQYYARQWSRFGMRHRADAVDPFGLDRVYEQRVQPLLDTLYDRYFRVQARGVDNIPASGGALLVCNRGGALPWDALMLKTALLRRADADNRFRWLTEDFNFHAPFLGPFLNRIGAVRACQPNAERLLADGNLVGVFPEGIKGVTKLFSERYQLQRFGRGGHIKLALRTGAPIIPAAIVGAEEAHPMLYRARLLSRLANLPFFPVTPTFPWLGPAGLLPLPTKWQIVVGAPMAELAEYGPEDADRTVVVHEINERLRQRVQELVDEARELRGPRAFA